MNRRRATLLVGMVLVALNFRPAITSIPPVLEAVRADLGLSYAAVSLLTTVPTLLMGVFAFGAAAVSRRLGRERAILYTVALVGVGTAARVWGGNVAVLFATTVVVGVAIAVCQALLPSIVNDRFPDRAALVTGLYTTSLGVGATVAAGATAPLADVLGSWPGALAVWAAFAAVAAVVWWAVVVTGDRNGPAGAPRAVDPDQPADADADPGESSNPGLPWGDTGAWVLTLFFSGQTLLYYAELTWLAPLYVDLGWDAERAGFVLTLFVAAQIAGSLGIPALADRWTDRRPWLAVTVLANAAGLVGVVWFPFVNPWLWGAVSGVGMGGMFALGLTLPADLASDPDAVDGTTAMMTGVGYVVGAVGPFAIGGSRDLLGSYAPAFVALVALSGAMLATTAYFRPDRTVA
jgi:CP family cyanate transporter-like MFS transporter